MLFAFIQIQLVFYTFFSLYLKIHNVLCPSFVYNVLITSNCFCRKAIRCASPLSEIKIEWRFND